MFFSIATQVVFKSTGGRIWNKRWGLPRLTQTRKENRKKDIKLFNQNLDILKAAQHLQPEVPVRLLKPLPDWQRVQMKNKLEKAQRLLNLRGHALPRADLDKLMQQQIKKPLPQPPQDPQKLQHHLQQRIRPRIRHQ
jgi:hypothetical protein